MSLVETVGRAYQAKMVVRAYQERRVPQETRALTAHRAEQVPQDWLERRERRAETGFQAAQGPREREDLTAGTALRETAVCRVVRVNLALLAETALRDSMV